MPIYEYECPVCGTFEIMQKVSDPPLTECETCKANGKKSKVEKLISPSAFHLKGSGWYKTDYASSSGGRTSSDSSSTSSSKTEGSAEGTSTDNGGAGKKEASDSAATSSSTSDSSKSTDA